MKKTVNQYLALWAILGAVAFPAWGAIETNHLDTLYPEIHDTPEIYLRKMAAVAASGARVTSRDVVTYCRANVLTNASVQDYVYAVVTNGFFRAAGGSGLLTTINIVSPTNGTYNVFFSGAPPDSATLGAAWNYSPTGNFATNAWGPPLTITLSTKKGAYWTGGQGNVNYSAFNGDGTTNGYAVITWGSSTSVSNAPGLTNIWVVLGGVDDSKP